jgi:hypothetical protein
MGPWQLALYGLIAIAGAILTAGCVQLVWRAVGVYRIHRAGPRRIAATTHVIWRDRGDIPRLDLTDGPGGPDAKPIAPFQFVEEHLTGSQPCVSIRDARGRRWRVKWGDEVRSENFAVRLVWACGYFAETTYFLASGRIEGASELQRAKGCIADDCRFESARFELDDPDVRKHFEEHSWAWNDNPFVGTPQLHGLKILTMLLSDWDTKDRRDVARGSNTAIFEHKVGRWRREARYLITDWGGSMGRWGSNIVTRGRWDPAGFEAQTPQFVVAVDDQAVRFGYTGQRTSDVAVGITVKDVQWLYARLGQLSDEQLRAALAASGAAPEETERFTRALRRRIDQLGSVSGAVTAHAGGSGAAAPSETPR